MVYINPLIGGVMIGLASGIYLLFNGRIMGVSGILGGLLRFKIDRDYQEKLFFIMGIFAAPWIYKLFAELPKIEVTDNLYLLIMAGLLVGFGTRLSSGCTSGHGVCGLGRGSMRSLVAVVLFMSAAIATVFVNIHMIG